MRPAAAVFQVSVLRMLIFMENDHEF